MYRLHFVDFAFLLQRLTDVPLPPIYYSGGLYHSGNGSSFEYGISRIASFCPCATASSIARSTISQLYLPRSGSKTFQYQRRYAIEESGKSGLLVPCGNFFLAQPPTTLAAD